MSCSRCLGTTTTKRYVPHLTCKYLLRDFKIGFLFRLIFSWIVWVLIPVRKNEYTQCSWRIIFVVKMSHGNRSFCLLLSCVTRAVLHTFGKTWRHGALHPCRQTQLRCCGVWVTLQDRCDICVTVQSGLPSSGGSMFLCGNNAKVNMHTTLNTCWIRPLGERVVSGD